MANEPRRSAPRLPARRVYRQRGSTVRDRLLSACARLLAAFAAIGSLVLLVGCGDDERVVVDPAATAEKEETPAPDEERYRLYGPDGELLESNKVIAGLPLPRGLEIHREERRRHIFYSDVPLEKLQSYFGKRLITGKVDRVGAGAIYREAIPHGVKSGVVKMDVSILPASGKVRVELFEIPPAPPKPLPVAELEMRLRQRIKTLD